MATAISTLAELEYMRSEDIHLRKSHRGTQAASVTLPIIAANKLLQRRKVRIGWVNCRFRLIIIKCYRCHQSGHQAKECKNEVERPKKCFYRGKEGHKAENCGTNKKQISVEFRTTSSNDKSNPN